MKNITNKIKTLALFAGLAWMALACDMNLQPQFDYNAEIVDAPPFDMTVLEWMRSVNQDPALEVNGLPEFSYLLEAIDRTGLEELYNKPEDNRTFFLLKNQAWKSSGQLLAHVAGSANFPLDSISTEKLEHILKYHIVDAYVDQGPGLPSLDKNFKFQTLVPGDTGVVYIKRGWTFDLSVNRGAEALPSNAKGIAVELHNYKFTNGIAHQVTGYFRYRPF
ncbi:hypothetical protein GCM10007049_17160 [Echinicola pacifica]|uniref:FAS1 domain-containing protein n=1 Tax=Echinicola pacifica TaxID=346377 RepID=A0A918PYJ5_9BACT|nr:fasciclin domain-containing protein [Echinicola pacifica]GGZ25235.1 hypothetical protein GCM10007049_17160 [Echinicola pacifica]